MRFKRRKWVCRAAAYSEYFSVYLIRLSISVSRRIYGVYRSVGFHIYDKSKAGFAWFCLGVYHWSLVGSDWSGSLLASFWSAGGRPSWSFWLDQVDFQKTAAVLQKPVWPPQRTRPKILKPSGRSECIRLSFLHATQYQMSG